MAWLSDRARQHLDAGAHLVQQLVDEEGVTVVVLDEQDLHLIVADGEAAAWSSALLVNGTYIGVGERAVSAAS